MPQHKQFSVLRRMFLAFVLSLLSVLPAMADTVIIDPLQFDLNQDGKSYSVCLYNMDYSGEIVIPAFCNGLPVTKVGGFPGGNITSVIIPENVTTLGPCAFFLCSSLEKINLPNSLTYIGTMAFDGCDKLTSIDLPNSVTYIGNMAFRGCKFSSIDMPNSLEYIGDGAFEDCNKLTSINLPNSLKCIDRNAFTSCGSLKVVTSSSSSNPASGGYIAEHAFMGCSDLAEVTIPNSIDSIGPSAFSQCGLESITLPEGLAEIGVSAFEQCSKLKEISIPNSVKKIGSSAFRNSGLESIILPDGLTEIASGLLAQTSLKSIKIPDSVTEIGGFAFEFCKQLESVILPNSLTKIGNSAFYGCNYLKDIKLANSLTSIGKRAFYNSGISTLVLPNSLTCLGDEAFSMCFSLKKVIFGTGLTEINPQTFSGCNLTDIVLPPNLIKINSGAFYTWTPIESLVIGSKVKEIGSSAFGSKDGIKSIYITSSEPPVAFENTFDSYTADLWLQDQDAIDKYTVSQPCWCKFEKKAMICAEKLEQKEEELIIEAGATHQLSVAVKPENATLKHVFWRSTNPNVASVDNNGLVTFPETNSPTYEIGQKAPASDCKIIAYTLYDNGPIAEFTVKMPTTAVEDVTVDRKDFNADENIDVFNINGVRVSDSTEGLAPGLYILRQGMTTKKVFIK